MEDGGSGRKALAPVFRLILPPAPFLLTGHTAGAQNTGTPGPHDENQNVGAPGGV